MALLVFGTEAETESGVFHSCIFGSLAPTQQLFITDSKALVAGQVTQSALVVTLPDTGNGAVTE